MIAQINTELRMSSSDPYNLCAVIMHLHVIEHKFSFTHALSRIMRFTLHWHEYCFYLLCYLHCVTEEEYSIYCTYVYTYWVQGNICCDIYISLNDTPFLTYEFTTEAIASLSWYCMSFTLCIKFEQNWNRHIGVYAFITLLH